MRQPIASTYSLGMERLLERDGELAALNDLLDRGGVTVIEGGAGIGKSALLDATCRRARELGHEVLQARGSELETGFAFGAVRQLFERRLADANKGERDALLAGHARCVGPLLLDELPATSAVDTSFAVLHGLYWLTLNLAERKKVFVAIHETGIGADSGATVDQHRYFAITVRGGRIVRARMFSDRGDAIQAANLEALGGGDVTNRR